MEISIMLCYYRHLLQKLLHKRGVLPPRIFTDFLAISFYIGLWEISLNIIMLVIDTLNTETKFMLRNKNCVCCSWNIHFLKSVDVIFKHYTYSRSTVDQNTQNTSWQCINVKKNNRRSAWFSWIFGYTWVQSQWIEQHTHT